MVTPIVMLIVTLVTLIVRVVYYLLVDGSECHALTEQPFVV